MVKQKQPKSRRAAASRRADGPAALPPPTALEMERPLTIAGVGASAGGLEAFSALLHSLPAAPGTAIVFVQHLAPQHESALVPLLSAQSGLPCRLPWSRIKVVPSEEASRRLPIIAP